FLLDCLIAGEHIEPEKLEWYDEVADLGGRHDLAYAHGFGDQGCFRCSRRHRLINSMGFRLHLAVGGWGQGSQTLIAKGWIIDAKVCNSGKRHWALPGCLGSWMPVILFLGSYEKQAPRHRRWATQLFPRCVSKSELLCGAYDLFQRFQ